MSQPPSTTQSASGQPSSPNRPTVRHASTVLLLRDSDRGVEVFMERRHIESDFVGGAYVFPGGAVDPEDEVDEALCAELTDQTASARLGLDHGGLAFHVAAIRECFEEAGVLFAYRDGELLDFADPETAEHFSELRAQLNAGERNLLDIAAQEDLELATDRIEYWAHWITPEGSPKRFDTRFFVAHAPEKQRAVHDDGELVKSAWVTAEEAMQKAVDREWMIIFPTFKNLQLLSRFPTAEAAITTMRSQTRFPAMQPRVLTRDGESRVTLPGDEGYDESEPDMTKADPRAFDIRRL